MLKTAGSPDNDDTSIRSPSNCDRSPRAAPRTRSRGGERLAVTRAGAVGMLRHGVGGKRTSLRSSFLLEISTKSSPKTSASLTRKIWTSAISMLTASSCSADR